MERTGTYIAWAVPALGYTSCIYFLSLVAGIPFLVTVLAVCFMLLLLYRGAVKSSRSLSPLTPAPFTSFFMFTALLLLLTFTAYLHMPAAAAWDGYGIWNLHARYLHEPAHWQQLFRNGKMSHPDYPALLPSCIAFVWRLTGHETELVPFGIAAATTLLIPVWLFVAVCRRNIWIAGVAMISFCFNTAYLQEGMSQYADTLVAMFFMGAFICIQQYKDSGNKLFVFLAAAMLGCAAWTKNEGIMLAGIFALFYLRLFLKRDHILPALAGVAPFAIMLLIYKSYAPANDLVAHQHGGLMAKLTDLSRYKIIAAYFIKRATYSYVLLQIAVAAYLLFCTVKRKWPGRPFMILLVAFAGYFMVYVLTPNDLAWHLDTSADRLVQQLLPAAVYILSLEASTAPAKRSQE